MNENPMSTQLVSFVALAMLLKYVGKANAVFRITRYRREHLSDHG